MALAWLTVAGGAFLVWLVLVFLFTPGINYHLSRRTSVNDKSFLHTMQSTCQARLHHGNRVTIVTDGPALYPAILDAIRGAKRAINREVTLSLWQRQPVWEKLVGPFVWILERQQ